MPNDPGERPGGPPSPKLYAERRSALSTIGQPVLALQSTRVDQAAVRVPIAAEDGVPWLELLREHVRQLGVEIIAGAGHFSMIERPTAVNAAIEKFISSLLV